MKHALTIELRYLGKSVKYDIIGVYPTLAEAVKEGNKYLGKLSEVFEVRKDDLFMSSGYLGYEYMSNKLVSDCCYPTDGFSYFLKIEELSFPESIDKLKIFMSDFRKKNKVRII